MKTKFRIINKEEKPLLFKSFSSKEIAKDVFISSGRKETYCKIQEYRDILREITDSSELNHDEQLLHFKKHDKTIMIAKRTIIINTINLNPFETSQEDNKTIPFYKKNDAFIIINNITSKALYGLEHKTLKFSTEEIAKEVADQFFTDDNDYVIYNINDTDNYKL